MTTLLRLLFGLLAAAVVLAVAVVVFVLLFVDPNDYRGAIAAAVQSRTGRELAIEGDLGLDLFPCCGIRLGRTSLSNPPGFDGPQFARVDAVHLGLRLWPLLMRRELIVDDVELEGLDLNLVRRADGGNNWSFAGGDETAAAKETAPAEAGFSLSVAGISISDSRVAYRDAAAKADYQLDSLNLRTGAVEPGAPFELETGFRVLDKTSGTSVDAQLGAIATLDLEAARARLEELDTRLSIAGGDLPASAIKLDTRIASVDYDLDGGDAQLAGISGDITLSGKPLPAATVNIEWQLAGLEFQQKASMATLTDLRADIAARGDPLPADTASARLRVTKLDYQLDSSTATLSDIAANIAARGKTLPASGVDVDLSLAGLGYDLDTGNGKLATLNATGKAGGAELRVAGAGVFRNGSPQLQGQFELPPGSPRDWLAALGKPAPVTADPAVLTRLEAGGRFALTSDSIALQDLSGKLDDTRIDGDLAVHGFDRPDVRIALVVDAIDADRYLAPASDTDAAKSQNAADSELPRDELRDLSLDGTVRIGSLRIAGTRLEQVQATARIRDGVLTLEPLTALLYGGRYDGSIRVDGSGERTQVELQQSLDAVQVGRLLTDLADVEQLEGLIVAKLDLNGSGRTETELRDNLAGSVSFELADGVYKGLDVWHEIRAVRAKLRGEPPPERTGPAQTRITALDFAGRLTDGKLQSERMVAQIPFLRITGDGALNLADEQLDYRFKAKVLQVPEFPDGERLKDLEGWTIPLRLAGTLANPKLGVDLAEFAKTRAAEQLRDKLFDKLGLEQKKAPTAPVGDGTAGSPGGTPADTEQPAPEQAPAEQQQQPPEQEQKQKPETPEEVLKRRLQELLGRP